MRSILIFLILGALSYSLAFAEERKSSDYRISANDLLEISVYEEPDLKKTVRVNPDGTIAYPLLGPVSVAGLTTQELEEKMTGLLAEDYLVNPQVSVFIKEYAHVVVLGQVKGPGSYELKDGLTVIGAIALAGGFTDVAAANSVRVIRTEDGRKRVINVPVGSMLHGGDRTRDVVLKPNDTIVIPESFF